MALPCGHAQDAVPAPADLISMDFKEADILTVLQVLARQSKQNLVASPEVQGKVSIHLEEVTWQQALDTIVQNSGLAYEKKGNVILISTLESLRARRETLKALAENEALVTRVIQLEYLDANDVKKFLEPQLSEQGKISVLEMTGQKGWTFGTAEGGGTAAQEERKRTEREASRSRSIVVTDTPSTIDRIEKILQQVDIIPRQILIEARVMEVNRDLLRDLGLEVGTGPGSTTTSSTQGFVAGTTSRTFSQQSVKKNGAGGTDVSNAGGSLLNQVITPANFIPEATGLSAANAGLSLLFRQLRGTQAEIMVRALEEDVNTNTLSAPNILTLSGQEARILIGEKFPILNTQVSGTDTTTTTTTLEYYQDIGIELYVVPQISGDKFVDMIIHPVVSARTGSVGANQYPILDVREAETQVVMENGETVVIGGLLKDVKTKSQIGIPFLGKIPVLGHLFSRTTTDNGKVDLLIFLTAHIIDSKGLSEPDLQRLRQRYENFFHEKMMLDGEKKKKSPKTAAASEPSTVPAATAAAR
jgi:type IV pilus assembly protein PilQ